MDQFLFDVAAVVFVAGSGAGEGDLVVLAVCEQVGVDELAAVVGVDAQHGEREPGHQVFQRGQCPLLGFVADRADFGPAGRDVGDGEGGGEVSGGVAAFVADQVDLHEPGSDIVPIRPGADRGSAT
jgi:hypothetical protein